MIKTTIRKISVLMLSTLLLSACGGGSSTIDTTAPDAPSSIAFTTDSKGLITVTGLAEANSTVTATFPDGSQISATADSDGVINFSLTSISSQPSGDIIITSTDSEGNVSDESIITIDTTAPNAPSSITFTTDSNGLITVTGLAEANSTVTATFPDGSQISATADSNGIINFSLTSISSQPSGDIIITSTDSKDNVSDESIIVSKAVTKSIYLATGTMPSLSFSPSLGINTEAPQGGADTAGMPIPFVDIFRTARPFKESQRTPKTDSSGNNILDENDQIIYIQNSTTYDENGWPTTIDPDKTSVSTNLLQGTLNGSIPEGQYTVLYEGSGTLNFSNSGSVSSQQKLTNENKILLDISLKDFILDEEDSERIQEQKISSTNQIYSYITGISNSSYVKNIRIIMPGGTCTGNPFVRVDLTDTCPDGTTYESFEERLLADRNAIIFNPDYLMLLRNFKVIRMMNLMEASLKTLCYSSDDCPEGIGTWDHRAKLDDAVWGGNDGRTKAEDHKGVPIAVMIELANTLQRDIWVNMPHIASDDYITNYATQVLADLDSSLNVYLEYSNEVWNSGFAAYAYAVSEGVKLGLDTVPTEFVGSNRDGDYFARLRFYSQRAVEIFDLWDAQFGTGNTRLIRVLGSFIGDKVLTEQMLIEVATNEVDAIAIAPYFYGCPYQAICTDAPNTLLDATTVDDIFAALDQSGDIDVKSIDGTIDAVVNQLTITSQYDVNLVSYEGGQHLVTGVLGNKATVDDQTRLRKLFNDANRDPRMKERYLTFLNAWKDLSTQGTTLFTLYTMPQSYYRYGNFGIKEHLNKSRTESPKFDGVMTFQESMGNCWWNEAGCTP